MSIENLPESLNFDVPKIMYHHIKILIDSIKAKFKDKIENEAWMQSINPDAILIKNLDILYEDNQGDDKKNNLCSSEVAQKFLRLIFKRAEGELAQRRKTGLVVIPHAIEYLKTQFGAEIIDKIQSQYRQYQEKLASIPIQNLECIDESLKEKKESEEFTKFIGRAKNVYVSTDEENIKLFLVAIKEPKFYEHEIFKDPNVLFYAMAACRRGQISPMQYAGFSQWIELKKTYGKDSVEIYSLFDDKGEFTKEAVKYFLKYIYNKKIKTSSRENANEFENYFLTKHNLEAFKEKLKKLPLSDQILIKIKSANKGYTQDIKFAYYASSPNAVLFGDSTDELSLLSINMYQSLLDTAFPSHPTKLAPQLDVGLKEVENSSRKNHRAVIVYYPRPKHLKANMPKAQYFHKRGSRAVAWIGSHDVFHAMVMSNINQVAFSKLGRTLDVIRSYTQRDYGQTQWTTGLWHLADAAYVQITDKTNPSEAFLMIISIAYQHDSKTFHPEMAAVILDMIFNPDNWGEDISFDKMKPLEEDIDFFKSLRSENRKIPGNKNLNRHLECIKAYSSFFNKNDDPKINLLKAALIYEGVKLNRPQHEMVFLLSSVYLSEDVSFKTIKKSYKSNNKEEWANIAYIHWDGKLVDKKMYYEILHHAFTSFDKNIDMNKRNEKGDTLLHLFAKDPQFSMEEINSLIESGADLRIKDNNNHSVLYYIAKNQNWKEFKYLLKKANIDIYEDMNGYTWLHLGIFNQDMEMIKYLVEDKKFDVNKPNSEGETPIYGLIARGWPHHDRDWEIAPKMELIHYLIDKGARDSKIFELLFKKYFKNKDIIYNEKDSLAQNFLNLFAKLSPKAPGQRLEILLSHNASGTRYYDDHYVDPDHKLRIQSIMTSSEDLVELLKLLTEEQINKLIEDRTWGITIASQIHSKKDFLTLSVFLPENFFKRYSRTFLTHLKDMELMKFLAEEKPGIVFLHDAIDSRNKALVKYLFEEINFDLSLKDHREKTALYYYNYRKMTLWDLTFFIKENEIDFSKSISLRNYVVSFIKNSSDLFHILFMLPESEQWVFWTKNKSAFEFSSYDSPYFILSSENIHFKIKWDLIHQYINSNEFDFERLLNYLECIKPEAQRLDILLKSPFLKDKMDIYHVSDLLGKLDAHQRNVVFKDLSWINKISDSIYSIDSFLYIQKYFTEDQQVEIILKSKIFRDKNKDKVDIYQLDKLLNKLSPEQIRLLIQNHEWMVKVSALIHTVDDFLRLQKYFTEDQQIQILLNGAILKGGGEKYRFYTSKFYSLNELLKNLSLDQKNQLILNSRWKDTILFEIQKYDEYMRYTRSTEKPEQSLGFLEILNYPNTDKDSNFFKVLCDGYVPRNYQAIIYSFGAETEIFNFINLLSVETLKKCSPDFQTNISDAIAAIINLKDPKIKRCALFALLKIYQSELTSEARPKYNPTLFGVSLLVEIMPEFLLGVPKEKKSAAVEALIDALLINKPLGDIYNNKSYSEALGQGDLSKISDALKVTEEEMLKPSKHSSKGA